MAGSVHKLFPWTSKPLIVNAPMGSVARYNLAVAVTQAGGLGQIGSTNDLKQMESDLSKASEILRKDEKFASSETLPIGVGLLLFLVKPDTVIPLLAKYKPIVIWLFAAMQTEDYATWSKEIRKGCPESKIIIQVGSVAGAVQIARSCEPDILVMQGSDAGGHGYEKGAGVISLIPETIDTLEANGFGHIPVFAAGGIVDGRGVAAAYTLGASGVVMGTRFLAATETPVHPKYQASLLEAKDGGQVTNRAKLYDELAGPNMWPFDYDGRSLTNISFHDFRNGVSIEQIRELHQKAKKEEDMGFGTSGRAAMWAGTGVGLVKSVEAAADIVIETRKEALRAMEKVRSLL